MCAGISTPMESSKPLDTLRHKPVSIAAYSMGPFGGIRAAQLARYNAVAMLHKSFQNIICQACLKKIDIDQPLGRPFLSELGLVPLPSTLLIPTVQV